mmetsp:Transcript_6910/g.25776  ORF Transcript_6910/g.25776 Transcript_6910/m.25776 type:complete len:112 (+) Transcript_6910:1781-2116(+)
MSRLQKINHIKNQVKISTKKSSQRAHKLSKYLLISGPFLGGLPWILNYILHIQRFDSPGAVKYARMSGKLVLLCYMTIAMAYLMGNGNWGILDRIDKYYGEEEVVAHGDEL